MKWYQRCIGCLLSVVLFALPLSGCFGNDEVAPSEVYQTALTRLWSATELTVQTNMTQTNVYYNSTETDTASYTAVLDGYGTDDFKVRTVAVENVAQRSQEYIEYFDGTTAYRQINGALYRSNVDGKYALDVWNIRITPELYSNITLTELPDGAKTVAFSDATGYEAWLSGETTTIVDSQINVSAEASIDKNGNLTAIRYTLVCSYGGFSATEEIRCVYLHEETPVAVTLPDGAAECEELAYLDCVPLSAIAEAYESLGSMEDYMANLKTVRTSAADDVVFEGTRSIVVSRHDRFNGKSDTAVVIYKNAQAVDTYSMSEVYDGRTETLSMSDSTGASSNETLDFLTASMGFLGVSSPEEVDTEKIRDITVTDMGDAWMIEFAFAPGNATNIVEGISSDIYGSPSAISSAGAVTDSVHKGSMCIDKRTGQLLSHDIVYEGAVTLNGTAYPISSQEIYSYVTPCPDATVATGGKADVPDAEATPLLYRVTGKDGQEMYLFGTIHVGDGRSIDLPDELYAAFDAADAYAEETDFTAAEKDKDYLSTVREVFLYSGNDTVKDHLSEEAYTALREYLPRMGYFDETALGNYSVAYIQQLITEYLSSFDAIGYSYGVDGLLEDRAYEKGKKVYSIEDWRDHISMATMFDDDVNEMVLLDMLESSPRDYAQSLRYSYELWCAGNEADLMAFNDMDTAVNMTAEEKKLYATYTEKLITQRDAGMVKAAKGYLESGETVFMAVGHAHVIGKNGIAAQLKAAGYTVEIVQYQ